MEQTRRYWWAYIIIFLASQLMAGCLSIVLSMLGSQLFSIEWRLVLTLLVANLMGIFFFFLYRPQSITWTSTLSGLEGKKGRRTGWVFLLALPLILLTNMIQEVFFADIPDLVGEETFKVFIYHPVGFITVTLLGPLSEELLFRGGVQTDFNRKGSFLTEKLLKFMVFFAAIISPSSKSQTGGAQTRFSLIRSCVSKRFWLPIVCSALIFSFVHMNPAQMPAALILGLLMGFAYKWTGSLVAPVCIHVFNNSFACILSLLFPNDDSIVNIMGGTTSAGLVAIVCVFLVFILVRNMKRA